MNAERTEFQEKMDGVKRYMEVAWRLPGTQKSPEKDAGLNS